MSDRGEKAAFWVPVPIAEISAALPMVEPIRLLLVVSSQLTPIWRMADRLSSAILTRSKTWRGPGTRTRLMMMPEPTPGTTNDSVTAELSMEPPAEPVSDMGPPCAWTCGAESRSSPATS